MLFQLAYAHFKKHNYSDAIKRFQEGIAYTGVSTYQQARFRYYLGSCYLQRNKNDDLESAKWQFEVALKLEFADFSLKSDLHAAMSQVFKKQALQKST